MLSSSRAGDARNCSIQSGTLKPHPPLRTGARARPAAGPGQGGSGLSRVLPGLPGGLQVRGRGDSARTGGGRHRFHARHSSLRARQRGRACSGGSRLAACVRRRRWSSTRITPGACMTSQRHTRSVGNSTRASTGPAARGRCRREDRTTRVTSARRSPLLRGRRAVAAVAGTRRTSTGPLAHTDYGGDAGGLCGDMAGARPGVAPGRRKRLAMRRCASRSTTSSRGSWRLPTMPRRSTNRCFVTAPEVPGFLLPESGPGCAMRFSCSDGATLPREDRSRRRAGNAGARAHFASGDLAAATFMEAGVARALVGDADRRVCRASARLRCRLARLWGSPPSHPMSTAVRGDPRFRAPVDRARTDVAAQRDRARRRGPLDFAPLLGRPLE